MSSFLFFRALINMVRLEFEVDIAVTVKEMIENHCFCKTLALGIVRELLTVSRRFFTLIKCARHSSERCCLGFQYKSDTMMSLRRR